MCPSDQQNGHYITSMGLFPFSTAWKCTKGVAGFEQGKAPPLADFQWGLADTAGTLSWWHLDLNGFGTYVNMKAEMKW
jgi:hypothetical protein